MDFRKAQIIRSLTSDLRFRIAESNTADARVFVELMNSHYKRKVSTDYYYWSFFSGKLNSKCLFAENSAGTVIAAYGLRVLKYKNNNRDYLAGVVVDLIVDESNRSSGLYPRLEMEMEQLAKSFGCKLLIAFPNDEAYFPRVKQLDWSSIEDRVMYAFRLPIDKSETDRRYILSRPDDERIIGVYERARRGWLGGRDSCVRDYAYLNWRFQLNPRYEYKSILVVNDDIVVASFIIKVYRMEQGDLIGDIVDALAVDDIKEFYVNGISACLNYFANNGIHTANIWLDTGTVLDEVAKKMGFIKTINVRHVCFRALNTCVDNESMFTPYIMMADSEVY